MPAPGGFQADPQDTGGRKRSLIPGTQRSDVPEQKAGLGRVEKGAGQMEAMEGIQNAGSEDGFRCCSMSNPGWASGPWGCRVRSCLMDLGGGAGSVWKVLSGARPAQIGDA